MPGVGPEALAGSVQMHLIAAFLFAAGFGISGFLAQGRSEHATVPVIWSAAAVATPLWLLIACYAHIAHLDRSIPFAIVAIVLAGAFGFATEQLSKREPRPGQAIAAALFATGTLAALALAFTFALDKGWLTIALALMSLGTAWISLQRPVPFLRWLAAILAVIVVARIGYEPRIAGNDVGTHADLQLAAVRLRHSRRCRSGPAATTCVKRGDDAPLRMVEAAAILFTVLLVFMEIRHFVNGGDVYRGNTGLVEVALQVCSMLAMAIGLERLRVRTGSIVHNIGALVVTAIALLFTVFGLFLLEMPLFWRVDVGGLLWNSLLLAYGLPAVLMLALSYTVAGRRAAGYANTLAGIALVLALTYVTLQVRRFFHGPILSTGGDDRRRAVHLLAGVARLRRGAADRGPHIRLAARAACVRGRHRAHGAEGVHHRHVEPDRRIPRPLLHGPRSRAGRDRLALPAHPVQASSATAGGRGGVRSSPRPEERREAARRRRPGCGTPWPHGSRRPAMLSGLRAWRYGAASRATPGSSP